MFSLAPAGSGSTTLASRRVDRNESVLPSSAALSRLLSTALAGVKAGVVDPDANAGCASGGAGTGGEPPEVGAAGEVDAAGGIGGIGAAGEVGAAGTGGALDGRGLAEPNGARE